MARPRIFRIGTRGSQLARWQSDWVAARLRDAGAAVEIVEITTSGDVQQAGPVAAIGATGVFTKEIQGALLAGAVDLAVHSLKDLPTLQVAGLALAAVPVRENPADALITAAGDGTLEGLPAGARIGTGSVRRRSQLLALRPDLVMMEIRGNVDTRLRKLDQGQYDAIVLAAAGLSRLGWADRISDLLAPPRVLPAPGQGALGIECRDDDAEALDVVAALDDVESHSAVTAERCLLHELHGGCSAPVAAWGRWHDQRLRLEALVADVDGRSVLRASGEAANGETPTALGQRIAEQLLAQGAAKLIATARAL